MKLSYKDYLKHGASSGPEVYFNALYLQISHPISYVLVLLGFSPNQVSYASILSAIVGGVLIYSNLLVLGIVFLMISYLLDFCDGNVARVWNYLERPRKQQNRTKGIILEGLNTNVALLMMYGSLGFYLFNMTGEIVYLLVGFGTFGIKMITRYTRMYAYHAFIDYHKKKTTGTMQERYDKSPIVKIKFFLLKCLFAGNFYYVVYLIAALMLSNIFGLIFIIYASMEAILSLARVLAILLKKYE